MTGPISGTEISMCRPETTPDNSPDNVPADFTFQPPSEKKFLPWMAALSSKSIPFSTAWRDEQHVIVVDAPFADEARQELELYERRNKNWPPPPEADDDANAKPLFTSTSLECALGCLAILSAIHARALLSMGHWEKAGLWNATLIADGQWWRIITSLSLHANSEHLLSNLSWMTGLLAVLGVELGGGTAALAMLLSGILGNSLMFLMEPVHSSIGASTMVFGLLGLLCGIRSHDAWELRRHGDGLVRLIPWAPLFAGITMFGIYGTGPGTDVLAHACGFACGILLSFPTRRLRPYAGKAYVQLAFAAIAGAILFAAWHAALYR